MIKGKLARIYRLIARVGCVVALNPIIIRIYKYIASSGIGSNKCLEAGFLPVPVHFYSPIPDTKDLLKRKIWLKKSNLSGIDFNEKNQIALLTKLGKKYGRECKWPLDATPNPADFFLNNNCFSFGCAASLHTIIRSLKPKRIIEIGSGNSSKIISKALEINQSENGRKSVYDIIDPYPASHVKKRLIKFNRLIDKGVEAIEPDYFAKLEENDILFIDSSHSVKIGGDVNHLFLDILPILKPGVVVHIHDINLPYEYPKAYATNEVFRQFWTEQYLLQAFLSCNKEFEILLGMAYLMKDHIESFKKSFPFYDSKIDLGSGSFWIKKKTL